MTINHVNLSSLVDYLKNYNNCKLLIVTKNQKIEDINFLLENKFQIFGENRVQEARQKYSDLREKFFFNLHLIGPLQTNKVKTSLQLFDTIQSVDRISLIDEIVKIKNKIQYIQTKDFYIQVNIGKEEQKAGVQPSQVKDLHKYCLDKGLNITGLMCIPPQDKDPKPYFKKMIDIKNSILGANLNLSMGMSNDYKNAILNNSNLIRIGSFIFQ